MMMGLLVRLRLGQEQEQGGRDYLVMRGCVVHVVDWACSGCWCGGGGVCLVGGLGLVVLLVFAG